MRDRREYGVVCGTRRTATLAVFRGVRGCFLTAPCLNRIWPHDLNRGYNFASAFTAVVVLVVGLLWREGGTR